MQRIFDEWHCFFYVFDAFFCGFYINFMEFLFKIVKNTKNKNAENINKYANFELHIASNTLHLDKGIAKRYGV